MNGFHLTGVCVFSVLAVCGCSPRIDRSAIEANIRKTDPEIKRFLVIFPNAEVSFRTQHHMGAVYDDPRNQYVCIRQELADGIELSIGAELRIESDGVSFSFADDRQGWACSLSSRSRNIFLNESQLKALLVAGGDLASLKPFDIDFSLSAMDQKKVIEGVRALYPPAAKLYETFPDSRASVDKPIYQQRGKFSARVTLADNAELVLEHKIRVAEDGISVELAEEGTDAKRTVLYVRSESPIEMDLSSDQFNRIVTAKGAPQVVRQVWSERPQSKHLGDGIYTVPK